ncbi:hypothetical protein POVCU1_055020 [Plasmodium ovale curtisi]|uniref:PIR Superfamily Protein n=1 Tax=Plasmodium ovale curtisi TaxID=864141 RepID=A0A1A8X6E0_PLAOA|nr:hypothetical protein POVCU1_055020 [Plasmodium ovale curtisi]
MYSFYDIFTDIYKYEDIEKLKKNDNAGLVVESYCEELGLKYSEYEQYIKTICIHFMNFSEILNVFRRISAKNKHKSCGIMNYWINSDIRDINKDQILDLDFYNSLTKKLELKNFSKKYSSNNSCKMSPEVSSLTPLPHASKELVRIPEQSALTTEPDADSNDNPIHPIHSNEPFIIHTILCLTVYSI